ncbi:antibiotic biosynthesis monooxygenase [Enterobacter soli]|uniref:putative quinol monooxygenase n=1 Tax=Enterobacter soli TaxID=885040 RepID=UPI0028559C65|nr:antibiotic biosynthesis monooxygenase family protein [Enterobacter soli]MDR7940425.1 antibiotic biosynthesis monooxygenase family protein [Enterobacter soli]
MHDNITLVATITARQGEREKVLLALKTVERDVQGEPGCLQYQLYMSRENEHQFVMIERWQSALMLEKHTQAAPFKALVLAIDGRADLQVTSLTSAV